MPYSSSDSPTATHTTRLEWLLQGVLEVQSLVTEAAFDLDTFAQRVVDLAETLTQAKGAVIELVEGDEMVYRYASQSFEQHRGLRLKRATSLSGLCVATGQVLRCDDTEDDPRVDKEASRQVGIRSMLCTPLFESGKPVGVLKAMGPEPRAFDSNDQYLLTLMAGALGSALGRQIVMEALKTSEATFRAAMLNAPIGQALVDPAGKFIKVNAALCDLLGYTEQELLAFDVQSLTHPEDLERNLDLARRTLAGESEGYRTENRYLHKSGHTIWASLVIALVRDNAGNPNYFVAQVQDISEQREVERVKNEFISVVSHELRTPLTSIRGSLGLVLGAFSSSLPEKAKTLLEIASKNCERLIPLINDILDIDKIASGRMRFDMQERPLGDLMRKAVQAAEPYAQSHKVTLVLDPPPADADLFVDEDRLAQALVNLISNAVKFSPQGEVVRVSVASRPGVWRLSVSDNGPGIPEAFRARMFEKFSQPDSSETRRAGGTGLGLHITREIVQRMHGQIGFDTELGKGTVFWIEFPQVPSKTAERVSTDLPRILHVEDDPDFAEMLRAILHGHAETIVAATFFEAERMLATTPFDLIVLDVSLPDRSGLELLDRLQSRGERRPPVVLLCAAQPPAEFRARVASVIVKSRLPEQKIAETIVGLLRKR